MEAAWCRKRAAEGPGEPTLNHTSENAAFHQWLIPLNCCKAARRPPEETRTHAGCTRVCAHQAQFTHKCYVWIYGWHLFPCGRHPTAGRSDKDPRWLRSHVQPSSRSGSCVNQGHKWVSGKISPVKFQPPDIKVHFHIESSSAIHLQLGLLFLFGSFGAGCPSQHHRGVLWCLLLWYRTHSWIKIALKYR